jgi:hypothetical protein
VRWRSAFVLRSNACRMAQFERYRKLGVSKVSSAINARSAVLCHLGYLVGEFGREFRAGGDRASARRRLLRRVAHTPHYDGVKKDGSEPAVIGIFGQAPIEFKLTDPTKPPVREV